jgi:hypothetical protein
VAIPAEAHRLYRETPECVGVHVGGCVSDGRRFRSMAHAHTRGEHRGWICVLAARRLSDPIIAAHELAHLTSGTDGHTDAWRAECVRLGGSLDPQGRGSLRGYHRRDCPAKVVGLECACVPIAAARPAGEAVRS